MCSLFRLFMMLISIRKVRAEKMRQALTMDMLATDLADYLVRKGVCTSFNSCCPQSH
jgi:argininosuccinate lyase